MSGSKSMFEVDIDKYLNGLERLIGDSLRRDDLRVYTHGEDYVNIDKRLERIIISNRCGVAYAAVVAAALFLESIDTSRLSGDDVIRIQRFLVYARKAANMAEHTATIIPSELNKTVRIEDVNRIESRTKIRW